MNIKETFIGLTKQTYPHGSEEELIGLLPKYLKKDEFGNLWIQIGEETNCMFTSHLDTASHDKVCVTHVFKDNFIGTDGTSILGADDKAGVTIMLYMIQNKVPGLYYFFLGEERGCIGSKKLANKMKIEKFESIKKVISFDRRDVDSVITFQSSSRCCSEEFAKELSRQLNEGSRLEKSIDLNFNYDCDPTGVYTDSYQFMEIFPECTNISVGYYSEHTKSEKQDILHLEKLAKTCLLIDWENLPVKRNPNEKEIASYNRWGNYDYWDSTIKKKVEPKKRIWTIDYKFDKFVSLIEKNEKGVVTGVDISEERVIWERELISDFLKSIEVEYKELEWNGIKLKIHYDKNRGGHYSEMNRAELEDWIDGIKFYEDLKKTEEFEDKYF